MASQDSDKKTSDELTEHVGVDSPTTPKDGPRKGFYYHPYTQIVLLGFICFMCPGLFNALNGLGGGGQVDPTTGSNANAALYATFAFTSFFAGSVTNVLGPRLTLVLGATGYSLYIGSFLSLNIHPGATAFVIAAGAILGICAGLLWTAQGSIMLSYPTESQKGRGVAIFWSIFNLGGVVGSAVSLGQEFSNRGNSVGNGTYIAFLVLTLIGVLIPFTMANPNAMYRSDGSKVTTPRQPSWKREIRSLWTALVTDPYILLLFPFFFSSNFFYSYQFNGYNLAVFNIQARALNNFLYWNSQIVGSIVTGLLLDSPKLSRRTRAFVGWALLFFLVFAVHIWAYIYQRSYTREMAKEWAENNTKLSIRDRGYVPRLWLYIFFGILDASWQTTAYWLMGAMSNDAAKLAHFTGFYKSLQSAGAAGIWRADAVGIPYMNMLLSTWILLVAGLVFALPMIHFRVKNHTELEEEQRFRGVVEGEEVKDGAIHT